MGGVSMDLDRIFTGLFFIGFGLFVLLKPKVILEFRSGIKKRNKYTDDIEFNKGDIIWTQIGGIVLIIMGVYIIVKF